MTLGNVLDPGLVIRFAKTFSGLFLRTCQSIKKKKKSTVSELGLEVNRIEIYIVLMGKRTFLFSFRLLFRLTLCFSDQNFLLNKIQAV